MKEFLQKTFDKISNFFKENFNKKSKPSSDPFDRYKNIPDPAIVFKDTLGMRDIDRDSKIPENLKKILVEIENMGDRLRKLGESDGPYQMRHKTVEEITKNTANRTSAYIETIFKGLEESLTIEIKSKKQELEKTTEDVLDSKLHLDKLNAEKRWNPENYSKWAWLFLIFGLVLLAADVVLSLNITEIGFQLNEDYPLERWGMSLGITACAIYIKVYYEEFFLTSLKHNIAVFKPINIKGFDNNFSKAGVITILSSRFIVKSLLLIFILLTIYYLGRLRLEVAEKILSDNVALQKLLGKAPNTNISYSDSAKNAFIYLSLLFPLIGGVCMAISIKKFRNLGILNEAKNNNEINNISLLEIQKELRKCEQDKENCSSYINWSKTSDFIKNLTEFLFSCYLHGYEYAYRKHTMNLKFFEKAKEIRSLFLGYNSQLNDKY